MRNSLAPPCCSEGGRNQNRKGTQTMRWLPTLCRLLAYMMVALCPAVRLVPAWGQSANTYILSGSPPASGFGVDDDLVVYLNGAVLYWDMNGFSTITPPIAFQAQKWRQAAGGSQWPTPGLRVG